MIVRGRSGPIRPGRGHKVRHHLCPHLAVLHEWRQVPCRGAPQPGCCLRVEGGDGAGDRRGGECRDHLGDTAFIRQRVTQLCNRHPGKPLVRETNLQGFRRRPAKRGPVRLRLVGRQRLAQRRLQCREAWLERDLAPYRRDDAAARSGKNWRPCWQVTTSKVSSSTVSGAAGETMYSTGAADVTPGFPFAIAIIASLKSAPTTRPCGPTCSAAIRATVPGPVAMSRTASPGRRAARSSSSLAHGMKIRGT